MMGLGRIWRRVFFFSLTIWSGLSFFPLGERERGERGKGNIYLALHGLYCSKSGLYAIVSRPILIIMSYPIKSCGIKPYLILTSTVLS